jgi:PAS domain S-box-containing protein
MTTSGQAGLYRALIEDLADAMIFTDRDGLIRVWNSAAEAVFGHRADEIIGKSLDVLIPDHLRSAHWVGFDTAMETGQLKHVRQSMTTRSIHKDGSDLYIDMSFALVRDEAGLVLGAVAVARDVTDRFKAEKNARKRLAELEARVNSSMALPIEHCQ